MIFSRTEILIGAENLQRLKDSRVAVFGVGGVGGHLIEALARCGVGNIDIFDGDTVSKTNINRQTVAFTNTIGLPKVDIMKDRIKLINPDAIVNAYNLFYTKDNSNQFDFTQYDYIADVIDMVSAKLEIVQRAFELNIPVISSMGTGNKLNPTMLEVADIYETSVCPLARVMRRELKKRGVSKLKVIYSKEEPITPRVSPENLTEGKHQIPGSVSFVPSVAGIIIASEIIKDLIKV